MPQWLFHLMVSLKMCTKWNLKLTSLLLPLHNFNARPHTRVYKKSPLHYQDTICVFVALVKQGQDWYDEEMTFHGWNNTLARARRENGVIVPEADGRGWELGWASQGPPVVLGKHSLSVSMETNPEWNETERSGADSTEKQGHSAFPSLLPFRHLASTKGCYVTAIYTCTPSLPLTSDSTTCKPNGTAPCSAFLQYLVPPFSPLFSPNDLSHDFFFHLNTQEISLSFFSQSISPPLLKVPVKQWQGR